MAHDVAISYVSEDKDRASEIYHALRDRELNVYWDSDPDAKLDGWGKSIEKELRRIYRQAECAIVLLSPSYFLSDWTALELASARNALPVVIEPTRIPARRLSGIAYSEWPDGGVEEFIEIVLRKIELLHQERDDRKAARRARLFKGLAAVGATAAGMAATAAANRRTQAKLEENTGSIDGTWVDIEGNAWTIEQQGADLALAGRTPYGVDVYATGTRNGNSLRAQWESPRGNGAIAAEITAAGRRIHGQVSGPMGVRLFVLSR